MKKLSFDFDGTLDELPVSSFLQEYIWERTDYTPEDIHIITARSFEYQNDDMYKKLRYLGIPIYNVRFTAGGDKSHYFENTSEEYLFHIDDATYEIVSTNFIKYDPWDGNLSWKSVIKTLLLGKSLI